MDGERRFREPLNARDASARGADTGAGARRSPARTQAARTDPRRRRRSRAHWLAARLLAMSIAIASMTAAALWFGMPVSLPTQAGLMAQVDRLLIAGGLGLEQIAVTGTRKTSVDEVFAALELDNARSIIRYDLAAARLRLQELPWVRAAELTRTLPDGLTVRIEERLPFAVWQNRQLLFVIDHEGRTLDPIGPKDYPRLPVMVGAGAAEAAPQLLTALAEHPRINALLGSAQRIGNRRWTLKLRSGPEVLLPATARNGDTSQLKLALVRLEQLLGEDRLMERAVTSVDLRLEGQLTFRLEKSLAAGAKLDAAATGVRVSLAAPAVSPLMMSPAKPTATAPIGGL